jgi:hypothetical protein
MRIVLLVGLLLLFVFALSLRSPLPGLFPGTTAPVPPDELWELNRV